MERFSFFNYCNRLDQIERKTGRIALCFLNKYPDKSRYAAWSAVTDFNELFNLDD